MDITQIQPGDIVMNTKTGQERTVVEYRLDLGLIAFDDSNLYGWSNAQDFRPTGRRQQ